jgi:hypothetical protein
MERNRDQHQIRRGNRAHCGLVAVWRRVDDHQINLGILGLAQHALQSGNETGGNGG